MSALHDLERQLARAVDAGAAADPAASARELRSPTGARQPGSTGVQRRRRPRGRRLLAAILITGLATTGALAATGALRIAPEQEFGGSMKLLRAEGVGVRQGPVRILPLRVKDPAGGPPWTIRVYETTRHAACAQAGQLYRGRFGRVEDDGTGSPVFRVANADGPGFHVACSSRVVGGAPIVHGLSTEVRIGGNGSSTACAIRPGRRDPCPTTAITKIRFGILGPAARSIHAPGRDGRERLTQRVSQHGAYLLATAGDPRPFRAVERSIAAAQADVDRRFPRPDYGSLNRAERRVADRRWKQRTAYAMQRYRDDQAVRRRFGASMTRLDPVFATFEGGIRQQVIGGDATAKALPGLPPEVEDLPDDLSAGVGLRANYVAANRAVTVRFRAPVALDRMQRSYIVTIHGPRAPACQRPDLGYEYVGESLAAGDAVRVRVKSPQGQRGPVGWCVGKRYEVRVRLRTMTGLRGGKLDRPVAESDFIAR